MFQQLIQLCEVTPSLELSPSLTRPITTLTSVTAKNTATAATARLINLDVAPLISFSSLAITAFAKSKAPKTNKAIGTTILIISNNPLKVKTFFSLTIINYQKCNQIGYIFTIN